MNLDSEYAAYGESSRERLAVILLVGFGAVAGGLTGATAGIFTVMPLMVSYIGPPLSWLLGVAVGGALGASIGCYLILRLTRRKIFR